LFEVDIKLFQDLTVFIFRRNNSDLVTKLATENMKSVLIDRLSCGHHLTKMEENRH